MINSFKQNQSSPMTKKYKMFTTNVKTLGFEDLCKENTRQQIDVSKLGKFVVHNLIVITLNLNCKTFF